MTLTDEALQKLREYSNVKSIEPIILLKAHGIPDIFPFDSNYRWNVDNFGPIVVPKKGVTVPINMNNICSLQQDH